MSSSKTFYEILGVSKDASEDELKKAYRKLSLKYHPDRNSDENAQSMFQEINEAYENLGDPAKRQEYDMQQQYGNGGNPFSHMSGGMDDMGDINNLFSMLFGGGMGGMQPGRMPPGMQNIRVFQSGGMPHGMHQQMFRTIQRPDPIVKQIQITIEQSYSGCNLPIEIERTVNNNDVIITENETMYINIPPGIDENEMMIIKDKGNSVHLPNGGILQSDIKISFQIINETDFVRHGLDLSYHKTITLKEALCGFSFEIMHLNGKRLCLNNVTNPTVIKPNFKKIIPNLGMMRDISVGSMCIEFEIEFPDSLTIEQIAALKDVL
jgi:DnaJ-class molecular chaperone